MRLGIGRLLLPILRTRCLGCLSVGRHGLFARCRQLDLWGCAGGSFNRDGYLEAPPFRVRTAGFERTIAAVEALVQPITAAAIVVGVHANEAEILPCWAQHGIAFGVVPEVSSTKFPGVPASVCTRARIGCRSGLFVLQQELCPSASGFFLFAPFQLLCRLRRSFEFTFQPLQLGHVFLAGFRADDFLEFSSKLPFELLNHSSDLLCRAERSWAGVRPQLGSVLYQSTQINAAGRLHGLQHLLPNGRKRLLAQ